METAVESLWISPGARLIVPSGVFEHEQIIVIVKADRQSDVGDERTGGNFDIQTWRGSYVVPCSQAIGYGNKGLTGGVGCDWSVGR
jgi:hypothetical protein